MRRIAYEIVPHDGGWAYRLDGVYSETFANREAALSAAKTAAAEQQVGGEDAEISFQDRAGHWHHEHSDGGDRPEAIVADN